MADAIVESKAGILSVAYQEDAEAEDITMKDVLINVEEQAAENERRRRARNEERKAKEGARRPYNSERRFIKRDNKPAEAKAEVKAEAPVEKEAE